MAYSMISLSSAIWAPAGYPIVKIREDTCAKDKTDRLETLYHCRLSREKNLQLLSLRLIKV